ncbi:MAG: LTA synthase family protein [Lachnospiraceae bacterium]|nr:LTA synthase family protein [Lachnospiraceae bacterium]
MSEPKKKKLPRLNWNSVMEGTFAVKIVYALAITLYAFWCAKSVNLLIAQVLELVIVTLISIRILHVNKLVGNIVNDILLVMYDIQTMAIAFGNSYITVMMLSNVDSVEALTGNAGFVKKIILIAVSLIIVLLPVREPRLPEKIKKYARANIGLSIFLALELVFTLVVGNAFSPYYAYVTLLRDKREHDRIVSAVNIADDADVSWYYHDQVYDYHTKDYSLTDQPNVILVFVEGLSNRVISDERDITPNLRRFSEESIRFENYFGHTAATYRGLIGQLYSGYQLDNEDRNALVSMQELFAQSGYTTEFINPEPNNKEFSSYLADMNFERFYSVEDNYEGAVDGTMSDREAFEILFEEAEKLAQEDKPFLLSMYSFGTHVYSDSPNQIYGDGNNCLLNRFYNMDYYFGEFIDAYKRSGLADDTVLIITADHGTYLDAEFEEVFPDSGREYDFCDTIPLLIYYNGIQPQCIDADGLNSLDLAPTICDFVDISGENYFLGESLFRPKKDPTYYDTLYFDGIEFLSTANAVVTRIEGDARDRVYDDVIDYLMLARRTVE